MCSSMPTASRHPGTAFPLIAELALSIYSRIRGAKFDKAPSGNFYTQRVGIASAICIRNHGIEDLDEHAPEVNQWLALTSLPYLRRLLLIQAGVPVNQALSEDTRLWDDTTLRTMIALRRLSERR